MGCEHRGGAADSGGVAGKAGRQGPAGSDSNGSGTGCGICDQRIASTKGGPWQMGCDAGGEQGDCGCGGLLVSGDGGVGASACGGAAGVSVCAGIFEFSGDTGAAGGAQEVAEDAGFIVLRWAGICASEKDGFGDAFGDIAEPADDWVREEHFDRGAWASWAGERCVVAPDSGWRDDWGGGADKNRRKAGLCFAGSSGFARDSDSNDACGE